MRMSHTELVWGLLSGGRGPAGTDGFACGTKGRAAEGQGLTVGSPSPGEGLWLQPAVADGGVGGVLSECGRAVAF